MEYSETFSKLRSLFFSNGPIAPQGIKFGDVVIYKFNFHSSSYDLLPGNNNYYCKKHNINFNNSFTFFNDVGTIQNGVHIEDIAVEENRNFSYYILKPQNQNRIKKVTFLFHGFNEKNWDKYLPWAEAICARTQSAIVFFPIAFHMQRSPLSWSDKRKMYELSEKRKKKYPNIINSTLSNVAISMRLHSMPQRFIWSGLQTYYDVINFLEDCRNDRHELIDKQFSFDIFAYSIGGLLALILKLSNHNNYFDDSKVCLFCSGAVFNRLSPVSKFILDSEANVALYSYLIEHIDIFLKRDALLHHYIEDDHFEGKVFRSMLDYHNMREFREALLRKFEKQIYAISLKKDSVIPSFEIMNTLNGAFREIQIKVEELDFSYDYMHENPFPVNHKYSAKIDENFTNVFEKVGKFLSA